ncbi:MAG: tetratricopeptide repeat protein [Acidobacteriota bacterium]
MDGGGSFFVRWKNQMVKEEQAKRKRKRAGERKALRFSRDRVSSRPSDLRESPKYIFSLAKPPVGWGVLIVGALVFVILIYLVNVFLTITLAVVSGFLYYLLKKENRSRRLTQRAVGYHLSGHDEQAQQVLQKALGIYPQNYRASYLIGFILSAKEKYGEAIPYFDRYLEYNYEFFTVYLLSKCYYMIGEMGKAAELLKQIPPTSSSYMEGLLLLADCYRQQKNLEQAIEVLKRGVEFAESSGHKLLPRLRLSLAEALHARGDYRTALEQYETLYQGNKDNLAIKERIAELKKSLPE